VGQRGCKTVRGNPSGPAALARADSPYGALKTP
jgi:hypothetical protein